MTRGKLEFFEPKKFHHFVDLDEPIIKMYTVLRFQIVFHKIIEKSNLTFEINVICEVPFYFIK
jgi:hypothetical protein